MPRCSECQTEHPELKRLDISPLTLVALLSNPPPAVFSEEAHQMVCCKCYQAEQQRRFHRYQELIRIDPSSKSWRARALGIREPIED